MTYHPKYFNCPECKTKKSLYTYESVSEWGDLDQGDPFNLLRIWEWHCENCNAWKANFNLDNNSRHIRIGF